MSAKTEMEELLKNQIIQTKTLDELAYLLENYIVSVEIVTVKGIDAICIRSQRVQVTRISNMCIEIRHDEHAPPHFHVVGPDINASFTIEECRKLSGEVDGKKLRLIERFFNRSGGKEHDDLNVRPVQGRNLFDDVTQGFTLGYYLCHLRRQD